jgi:hypothetical protein
MPTEGPGQVAVALGDDGDRAACMVGALLTDGAEEETLESPPRPRAPTTRRSASSLASIGIVAGDSSCVFGPGGDAGCQLLSVRLPRRRDDPSSCGSRRGSQMRTRAHAPCGFPEQHPYGRLDSLPMRVLVSLGPSGRFRRRSGGSKPRRLSSRRLLVACRSCLASSRITVGGAARDSGTSGSIRRDPYPLAR